MLVFLTGFMASGKSSVGRCLAEQLGVELVDLDREIEKEAAMSVAEIFRREGEPSYRARETAALAAVALRPSAVVATGGGVVLAAENRELLARSGVTVWLNPGLSCLESRLGPEARRERPVLAGARDLEQLWRSRLPYYRQADLEVQVADGETVEESARRVRAWLEERSCAT